MYKKIVSLLIVLATVVAMPYVSKAQDGVTKAQGSYSFNVEKTGHGPAMILIPGLDCSGAVWKETVAHYKDRYTCYSLTLPGFAGQPAIHSDSLLATVAREIGRYIVDNKLNKPLLVGHSLGGWLALEVAVVNPGLPGGIICVSSAPFLPALSMGNSVTIDSARKIGAMIRGYMSNQTPEQARQSDKAILPTMISDTSRIAEVTEMALRCDAATQGECMYELFSTDLRPEMGKVDCPVLVLGDWVSYRDYGATRQSVMEKYQQQFAKAPHVNIRINDASKHFIMFDVPDWFFGQVDEFLAAR